MKNFNQLSDQAQLLVMFVVEKQDEGFYDERGAYVEHDSFECKPFSSECVTEVVESGLVDVHQDSDDLNGGVAFLTVKKDFFESLNKELN